MSVTYHHDPRGRLNPHPLTCEALGRPGVEIERASIGQGPLAGPVDIMGFKLSPSLKHAGAGVLEIDYADGSTLTFDVDAQGNIEPHRFAYAAAVVFESVAPLSEAQIDTLLDCLAHAPEQAPDALPGVTSEYASTPEPIGYRPNDDYGVRPRDENAGGRDR